MHRHRARAGLAAHLRHTAPPYEDGLEHGIQR